MNEKLSCLDDSDNGLGLDEAALERRNASRAKVREYIMGKCPEAVAKVIDLPSKDPIDSIPVEHTHPESA